MNSIDNLIEIAEDDNLLPEFHKILRKTPLYERGKVVNLQDYRNYIGIIEDRYEIIKYKDCRMNE